jgi:hypothetical protein
MEITACPKCGSRNIFQGRLKDGVLTGYTSREVCRDCGYTGSPIIFDSEKEYNKFLEGLEKDDKGKNKPSYDKEKELTQVVEFLNETADEIKDKSFNEKKPMTLKNSILFLGIVVIIAGIWIVSRAGFLFIYGTALLIVGVILIFVGIFSPRKKALKRGYKTKPTIGGIFLMMAGVLGSITWMDFPQFLEDRLYDPLLLQDFGIDIYSDLFISILLFCAVIGFIFSIFSILGGILAIERKHWMFAIIGGFFGILTLGPLFSSSIFSLIGLILISRSKKEFIESKT